VLLARTVQGHPIDALIERHRTAVGRLLADTPLPWSRVPTIRAVSELVRFDVPQERLRALGSRGAILAGLLERCAGIAAPQPETDWAIGFALPSHGEVDWLRRHAARIGLAPWRGTRDDPAARRILDPQECTPTAPLRLETGYRFPDPESEVDWVIATIAERVRTGELAPSEVRILVPDVALYPTLLRHASRLVGLELDVALRRPLRRTAPGRRMADAWALLATGHVPGDPHATAVLNAREIPPMPPEGAPRPAWLAWWLEVTTAVAPRGPQAAIRALISALSEGSPTLDRERFGEELTRALERLEVEEEGEEGIEVRPVGSPSPRAVRIAFQLGAVEDQFPLTPVANPALPLDLRRSLPELPSTEELVMEARMRTLGALAASEIVITAPARLGTAVRAPSAYLAELGLALAPAPPRALLSPFARARHDPTSPEAARLREMARVETARIRGGLAEGSLARVGPRDTRYSVSALVRMGQCPFKWLARHRLRVPELPSPPLTPDSRVVGSVVHALLEHHARDEVPPPQDALEDELEEAVHGSPTYSELASLPVWPLLRRQLARRIGRALADPTLHPPSRRTEVELPIKGELAGIPLVAVLDRVDELADGSYRILDYKTARSVGAYLMAKDATGKLRIHLQLGAYKLLVEADRERPVSQVGYYLVNKGHLQEVKMGDAEEVHALLAKLARMIASQRFPVEPDVDELACRQCELVACCRIRTRRTL